MLCVWRMTTSTVSQITVRDHDVRFSSRLLIAWFTTVIGSPVFSIFLRSRLAPLHLNPCQHHTLQQCVLQSEESDHRHWQQKKHALPCFMLFILRVAPSRSSLVVLVACWRTKHRSDQEKNYSCSCDRAQNTKDRIFGVINSTAKIEPGDAGETRPALNTVSEHTSLYHQR